MGFDPVSKIAIEVIKAQVASDSGKNIYSYSKSESESIVFLNETNYRRNKSSYRRDTNRRNSCEEFVDNNIYLNDRSEMGLLFNNTKIADKAVKLGYQAKTQYIVKAIRLINSCRRCGWNYLVVNALDQNNYDSIITYFEYKYEGHDIQISFHTPYNLATKELKNMVGKGRKCHWDLGSSRMNCQKLIDMLGL